MACTDSSPTTKSDRIRHIIMANDGGYVVSGVYDLQTRFLEGNPKFWVYKLNKDGEVLWESFDRFNDLMEPFDISSISRTLDGNYKISGKV